MSYRKKSKIAEIDYPRKEFDYKCWYFSNVPVISEVNMNIVIINERYVLLHFLIFSYILNLKNVFDIN